MIKWIKITDRLPRANKYILLSFWDGSIEIGEKLSWKDGQNRPIFLIKNDDLKVSAFNEEDGLLYWAELPKIGKRYKVKRK